MTIEQLKLGQSLQYPISPQDKQRLADWLDQHLAETIKLAIKQKESEKEPSKESEWHRLDQLAKSIAKELFHAKPDDQLEIWNRKYLDRLAELAGAKISLVGVGPDRDQTLDANA